MLLGKQTWTFSNPPVILATGTVGGPFEGEGPIKNDFDKIVDDNRVQEASFEKAHQKLMEEAIEFAVQKGNITNEDVNFFISGDLINQMTPTNFTAQTVGIPYLGLFSACATTAEGLALASIIMDANGADYIVTGSASHHAAAERQYRYPNDYGGQKPPTAQWTVTGAGCALLGKTGTGPRVTSATIGKVVDLGITDPFNMGGAMAPAAAETIATHLKERNLEPSYYDLIVTGDLGEIGRQTSLDLLRKQQINLSEKQYLDCGLTIYGDKKHVLAGASGSACSAVVTYGHLLNRMKKGEISRMLFVATGALHSAVSIQQGDSIPCIAHAVSIEMESGNI
ncbi:stage V sporulation protein AD [Oceanobacillus sp. CAU 1775]